MIDNQESPSEQFEEENFNLRTELLKNNRRETWSAIYHNLSLQTHLQRPCQIVVQKTPKVAPFELAIQISRELSLGLPTIFEADGEEDEDMFMSVTSSSYDEGFHERLGTEDEFTLPEPSPQSSVPDTRNRSSDDWIVGNELKQQLLDLQGQHDTLQCDYVIKMNEKDSKIESLKRELAYTQLSLNKAGKKDNYKKVPKELSVAKALPDALLKERDNLHRDLEKTKKVNMEPELRHVRQSTLLQRDINRTDSIVDQRLQSITVAGDKLQESEGDRIAAKTLVIAVTEEKEDIVEKLLDAHASFQRQKAELIAQAQENREKCNILNQDLQKENQSLLVANTQLQFALNATRDRLEIFEDRLDESHREQTEFKSLLQKAGFIRATEWNIVSLRRFEKHIRTQNNEARRLETELASKKMELIDLEVQFESKRAQCQKYEEEIQNLKTRVVTPEQETEVREIVQQNKRLQTQLRKAEEKAQEYCQLVGHVIRRCSLVEIIEKSNRLD